ncbi:hypothetical protein OROGR_004324 [Orobanche gracilis]
MGKMGDVLEHFEFGAAGAQKIWFLAASLSVTSLY